MTAPARSEGARSSCSILVDIRLNLGHGIYARRTVFDFGWRRQGCPRLGLEGEQGSPDHPAAVTAMQRRQDRPRADRDRLQRAHGGFDRSRADGVGRRLSRPLHSLAPSVGLIRHWEGNDRVTLKDCRGPRLDKKLAPDPGLRKTPRRIGRDCVEGREHFWTSLVRRAAAIQAQSAHALGGAAHAGIHAQRPTKPDGIDAAEPHAPFWTSKPWAGHSGFLRRGMTVPAAL
jgi:hypothetical protein